MDEFQKKSAEPLDPITAWKLPIEGEHGLRSRYSGCPLNAGKMVITILCQGTFSAGHSVIVFEWGHGYNTNDCYRKHKGFHLYPAKGQSVNEIGILASSTTLVPGRIERLRPVTIDGNTRSSTKPPDNQPGKNGRYYAEQELKATESDFMKGAKYLSWLVNFDVGYAAFTEAKRQWKNVDQTPKFNLLGQLGGHSCGTWAQAIASMAGIEPTSFAAKIGFTVPTWQVGEGSAEVKSESEMWEIREGKK